MNVETEASSVDANLVDLIASRWEGKGMITGLDHIVLRTGYTPDEAFLYFTVVDTQLVAVSKGGSLTPYVIEPSAVDEEEAVQRSDDTLDAHSAA
jgi:hypothetical protein